MTAALATGGLTGAATANDAPVSQRYAVIRVAELGDFGPEAGVQYPNADHQGTMGINNFGEVVYAHNPKNVDDPGQAGLLRAFVWLPQLNYGNACGLLNLDTLAGQSEEEASIARDINDAGQIVGQYGGTEAWTDQQTGGQATIWELAVPGPPPIRIDHTLLPFQVSPTQHDPPQPHSGFMAWSGAHAINNDADPTIVGSNAVSRVCYCQVESAGAGNRMVAFKFKYGVDSPAGFLTEINEPTDGQSEARDVMPAPDAMSDPDIIGKTMCEWQVVVGGGESSLAGTLCKLTQCGSDQRGALWEPANMMAMRADSVIGSSNEASSRGVNDAGLFVGYGRTVASPQCERRALLWDPDDTDYPDPIVNLGDFMPPNQEGDESRAEAINNNCMQQVVGWNPNLGRALRWHRDDTYGWDVLDLSDAIRSCDGNWEIAQAHDINDDGWIAAWGFDLDVSTENAWAVVLIPVPVQLGDSNGDFVVDQLDLDDVIAFWDQETDPPGCFWKRGDLTGDGMVRLPDLLAVINNWGTTYDPCDFTPDVCGASAFAGAGNGFMSGSSLQSGPPETPFEDLLEEWGFEDWEDAELWLESASDPDVMMFLLALSDAAED